MRAGSLATACVIALAGCGDQTALIAPVIDGPSNDPAATVFPDLDDVVVTVAHAGSADDLVSATFERGASVELDGVPFADDLVIHMTGQIDGADVAYGRTCTFAFAAGDPTATPHLFLSRTVKFASLAFTPEARVGGTAVTIDDGSGLLVGGLAGTGGLPVVDVERLDPNDGTFTVSTQIAARTDSATATLGVTAGLVAVVGGEDSPTSGSSLVELLALDNPPDNRVEDLPPAMQLARVGLTATPIPDGRIIAIGGNPPGGAPVTEIDEITQDGGDTEIDALHGVLAQPRSLHTATALTDDVGTSILIAGGVDATGQPIATAELFKSLANDVASPTTFAPQMLVPRSHHQAALMPDGSVLFIGGLDVNGDPVAELELFSFDTGFVDVGPLPAGAGIIDTTVTTLPDGRILITGGRATQGGAPVDTAYIAALDLVDGSVDVVPTDNLASPRAGHQATLLCDGTVLVSGGTDTATPAERYNPPATGRR